MEDYGAPSAASRVVRFLFFLRRFWWVPLLTLVLGLAGAAGYALWAPPVYVSNSAMWETEKLHLSEGAIFTEDSTTYIGTQIELLRSARMQQAALERLRTAGTNGIPFGKDGLPLQVTLSFREAPKTTVFVITASSADPAYSQNFLDTLMSAYLDYKKNVRKLVSGDTAASISAQVETTERELKAAQDALAVFQRTNNLAILQEEGTIAGGYLEKLQTELSDLQLESQLLQATALERKAGAHGNIPAGRASTDLLKTLGSAESPDFTPYQQLELLKMRREKLSKYLRPKHPKIVALDEEIARAQKLIELYSTRTEEDLAASQEAIKMKKESVLASIKDWETKVQESSSRIAEAEHLKASVARTQGLYDRLATLLQNVDITKNTDMETLAILEPASAAKRTYSGVVKAFVLAAVGGLVLGLAIVFLIERRDDRFTSVAEVNSALGGGVVGQLPELARNGKDAVRLLELDDPRHSYAESYRNLRSALLFSATDGKRPRILLVTSAMPGEGKSTVAANLARTLAVSGSRVLLVDADLRRGRLHDLLHLQKQPGLAEVLRGMAEPEDVLQRDTLPTFAFVASGDHVGNPGDLFLGSELDRVLAKWRQEFDYLVIDSSPLFAADDASCLAPKADATLFVVRRGHSGARAAGEALELLAQRRAEIFGVIFNGADESGRNHFFYKYEDYGSASETPGRRGRNGSAGIAAG
jgi:capsular exopolysaccharide synthesis family protein